MDMIYTWLVVRAGKSGIGIGVCVLLMVLLLLRERFPPYLKEALMRRENYVFNSYRGTNWDFYACFCNGKGALSYWGELAWIVGFIVVGFMIPVLKESIPLRIIVVIFMWLALVIQLIISITLYCKIGKRYKKSPLFVIGMCIWPYPFIKRIVEEDASGTDEE